MKETTDNARHADGQHSGRLQPEEIDRNFSDIHPPLTRAQAAIEAERCYYCYDAPCTTACPTGIDIPSFIKRISTGDLSSSAKRIMEENIFGGMCARVCPTETLCEEACVRNLNEDQPVKIGLLQRHATDHAMARGEQYFQRGETSGKVVAVVGAGPAGLSCAHRLATLGHETKVFEARPKAGGLNEYGIAAYKTVDGFAAREVEYILAIGGIEVMYEKALGDDLTIDGLLGEHDAVFVGMGLGGVRSLGIDGDSFDGVRSAVDFIAEVRQASLPEVKVGRKVVVIGGGMTAVDAASQSLRLGAEDVSLVYRRGPDELSASTKEISFAKNTGTQVRYWARPRRVLGNGRVEGIELEYTRNDGGKVVGTGETYVLDADMVLVAVGQTLDSSEEVGVNKLEATGGKISVDEERRTSMDRVWAGGDCVVGGNDLTVSAVEDGKVAAHSMDRFLRGVGK